MTEASNAAFGIGLALYLIAMLLSFHFLAYRREGAATASRLVAIAGLVVHGSSIVMRGIEAGRVPWGNMYEYASVTGFLVVALYVGAETRVERVRALGGFALGATVLIMSAAALIYVPPGPLVPALNSYWLQIHVSAAMIATALFTLGFVLTVLYLVQDRRERRAERETPAPSHAMASVGAGMPHDIAVETEEPEVATITLDRASGNGHGRGDEPPPEAKRRSRLPAAAVLDDLARKAFAFAFPIWTFAVIAGAVWAEEAWGRYWGWDPKEVWSFITWVFFAGYLHARATQGWRGRRAAVIAVLGYASLLFNLIVVNTAVQGLHSYA